MQKLPDIIALGEHKDQRRIDFESTIMSYYFKNQKTGKYGSENRPCFIIKDNVVKTHYYIGVDWLCKTNNKVIYVTPKLNKDSFEVDYLKMLLTCLNDQEASKHISKIYEIKTKEETIEINQDLDLLSPIIAIQFLNTVKSLVKKGLKKSYYREQKHLKAKVRGKLMVSQTLKHYTFKNQPLNTICEFDTFGLNHEENQILKAGLVFVKNYLGQHKAYNKLVSTTLDYCMPAFKEVTVPKNLSQLQGLKVSPFFSGYKEAISLAKVILKRFGYNIRSVESTKIKTHPFWINMPLLFELYAYTFLRKEFKDNIQYQYKSDYQELDFLLNSDDYKMVIDTKYKTRYHKGEKNKEDIRQLSGYARMEKVYKELGKNLNEVIDCLIIYPIRDKNAPIVENLIIDDRQVIEKYVGFYRLGLFIPFVDNTLSIN